MILACIHENWEEFENLQAAINQAELDGLKSFLIADKIPYSDAIKDFDFFTRWSFDDLDNDLDEHTESCYGESDPVYLPELQSLINATIRDYIIEEHPNRIGIKNSKRIYKNDNGVWE